MNTPAGRRTTKYSAALFAILGITALVALPSVQSRRLAPTSNDNPGNHKSEVRENGLAASFTSGSWITPTFAGETIEIFAADCTTVKTAFAAGETICAKTNGVDLTVAGNYYVNWFHPDSSETNGGTITQNPQYTLFSIPTSGSYLGTWKANIGRVSPAEGSIIGNPPLFTVSAAPTIATFAYTTSCTNTPKTNFVVGETVCARSVGINPQDNRRFAWVDADGITREFTPITTDPATDDYALLLTETSIGTWKANVVSSRGTTVVGTPFTVAGLTPSVDLSIGKALSSDLTAGNPATFTISVYSRGPNDAQNVKITDVTPANATFVSATQTGGSGFTCTGTSTVICTGAVMKPGEQAIFEFVYTAGSAGQTITNTATVESDTAEVVSGQDSDGDTIDDASEDNSATAGPYTISPTNGGGGDTCSVGCPNNIQTPANTTDGGGNPGAVVHFSPPSGNEECGNITVDHCNDCFFPEGSTVVTGTSDDTGESCSFTVTITAAGSAPTISCPANKSGDANSSCEAVFNLGTASASGQNVTVVAYRSDGKPVYTCDAFGNCTRNSSDAPFGAGTTTITWYAYSHDVAGPYTGPADSNGDPINQEDTEEGHRTGSSTCTQRVVVNDVTPPVIAATDSTVSADENCEAVIPDYSSTVSDNCACSNSDTTEDCQGHPHITYSQTPAAGTVVGLGPHTVHIEANDTSSNNNGAGNTTTKDVTFTVNDTTAPVITCPSNISGVPTEPGTCAATVNPGTATATDNCDSSPTITASRSDGRPLTDTYPKGTTTITWTATDDAGNHSSCDQTITVVDNEPPVIVFNGQTPSMWPPNHKYQTFGVTNFVTSVTDNCDSISVSSVYITKVTSDEIENGNGDGNTLNDIVIAADCKSVQLRSEREGNSNGRVYTIFFSVTDSSGNVGTGTATVVVRHNPGQTAVDSGPHYTVTSSCP